MAQEQNICDNCDKRKTMATQEDLAQLNEKLNSLLKTSIETMQQSLTKHEQHNTKSIGALEETLEQLQPNGLPGPTRFAPTFSGDGDYALAFIERFTLYSKLYNWSDDRAIIFGPPS